MVWAACLVWAAWAVCHQVVRYVSHIDSQNLFSPGMDMSAMMGGGGMPPGMDDLEGDSDDEDLPDLE